jgi:DNA-binding beta-propeller fold protein YncE
LKLPLTYPLLFSFIFLLGCTKKVGDPVNGNYPIDVGKIMAYKCATSGCHNDASYQAAAGLNLSSWNAVFRGSNSGSPIIPFSSKFSSLCYFVNTYPELGTQNTPTMPLNRERLHYEEVKTIKDWIDNGAPDIKGNIMWSGNPLRKKLYAVNQGCDLVTIFDSETQLPIRCIEVGNKAGPDTPHQVKVSPDGNYWYVLFINNNILQKYRCSDDAYVADIPLSPLAAGTGSANAQDWNNFIISRDGKRGYCASTNSSGSIALLDLEKNRLLRYLGGLYYPHGLALNSKEDNVYVTSQTGNYMTEIDSSFSTATEISLNDGPPSKISSLDPHEILLSPDGENFLITCQKSNQVRVYNISDKHVTGVLVTGTFPQEIVYSKKTDAYYITCTNDSTAFTGSLGVINKIDAASFTVSKIKCGYQPHGIAVDEAANLIYVLSRNISSKGPLPHHSSQCVGKNGFVNFIDLNSFALLSKKYELSVDPYYIYARP